MNLSLADTDAVSAVTGIESVARSAFSEALLLLAEGVAGVRDIDNVMRDAAGFSMGPFELLLDRVNPTLPTTQWRLGETRKTTATQNETSTVAGRGAMPEWRSKVGGRPALASGALAIDARPAQVWVSQGIPEWSGAVCELVSRADIPLDRGQRPAANALIVVTPLGQDASTLCSTQGLDPRRTVAVDCLYGLSRRRTLMLTPLTSREMHAAAHGLFGADGTPVTSIADSAGLIAQRIVAVLVNAACNLAQQSDLAAQDIDRAAQLQLGYRQGPLSLGDALGVRRLLIILEAMQSFSGDPRYRPSPWLKRRALLGVSLLAGR